MAMYHDPETGKTVEASNSKEAKSKAADSKTTKKPAPKQAKSMEKEK